MDYYVVEFERRIDLVIDIATVISYSKTNLLTK